MGRVPKAVCDRAKRATSDNDTYKACMTIIKARMFTIQRILNNEIDLKYEVLQVESIFLQFRMLLELLYLSAIVTRGKKYSNKWPRSTKEYQPSVIRKYLGQDLDEHFPYPYKPMENSDGSKGMKFFDRPVSEMDVYSFFNKCHQYLHEPNPYKKEWKKRERECDGLIKESTSMLRNLWLLLEHHYRITELDDGEKVGLICDLGPDEGSQVFVANLISEGKGTESSNS